MGNHGWTNESNSYINQIDAGNADPDEFNMNGNMIRYGQLLPSYAKYQDIIMPILKAVGSPPGTCSNNFGPLGEVAMNGNVPQWPTENEALSGQSVFGALKNAPDERYKGTITKIPVASMVRAYCPYTLYIEGKTPTQYVSCHPAIKNHLEQIFKEILQVYGAERIHALKMDVFNGSFYPRKRSESGKPSMHSLGIAFDWNASENGLKVHAPNATNSRKEWKQFWQIWEKHGAQSLGRCSDYDWMHVQFAKFRSSYPGPAGQKQDAL